MGHQALEKQNKIQRQRKVFAHSWKNQCRASADLEVKGSPGSPGGPRGCNREMRCTRPSQCSFPVLFSSNGLGDFLGKRRTFSRWWGVAQADWFLYCFFLSFLFIIIFYCSAGG